jgi:hypothetical protein
MAERIVSPGVFTREKDLSFLPAGVAAIGAAIVGPTLKGPSFVPTQINTWWIYQKLLYTLHRKRIFKVCRFSNRSQSWIFRRI